ncbi:hypothetical protein [Paenibacillus agricola]|uniref:Short-chain dehydrogenase n=1 Tax=Paenibacillus agricola TaxID=2716264 RepID=A0ABX0JDN9_9BACL|nr:hypothetical protein [Paenibacillus agricola]NHN33678.1 hypothetical protein [Paenibacillus agricola]
MIYLLLGLATLIIGVIVTAAIVRKQNTQDHEYDKGIHSQVRKHNIVANPILIAYILIPIAGVLLIIYYFWG